MRNLVLAALLAASPAFADTLTLEVAGEANGKIVIDLNKADAPGHVARIEELASEGAYDDVVFHRVIDGFMAQTGDVEYGKAGGDLSLAGRGGSALPDLKAEFSATPFERGTVGMAPSSSPDSANSQFFIMFAPAPHLNGQYTVVGHVVSGLDVLDAIKRGDPSSGAVSTPDRIVKATVSR
jgi:peptidylprolyl isomerase